MALEPVQQMIDGALASARKAPADASARMRLFRLLALTGQWDRAAAQLDAAKALDTSLAFTCAVHGLSIACERFRAEVFAGRRAPLILGEPGEWLAGMVQSLKVSDAAAAQRLRAGALERAPAKPGLIEGRRFEWIADADSRLGPVCEMFIDGKYYWVPFDRVNRLEMTPPGDMLDLVWMAAKTQFDSGGEKLVQIPVRYPGSESADDDALRTARRTEWHGSDEEGFRGLGQRAWVTDAEEFAMLDVRVLQFD
jgi:type VI secretion system protein ImpE